MSTSASQYYVVVCANNKARIIHGSFEKPPVEGDTVKRDPLTGAENWVIIKVYTHDQQQKLDALRLLMGGAINNLSWIVDHNM